MKKGELKAIYGESELDEPATCKEYLQVQPEDSRRVSRTRKFYNLPAIIAALGRELGWSHFKSLIPIEDPLKRKFYAEMCRIEGTQLTPKEAVRS
jgi:hypothetical protein